MPTPVLENLPGLALAPARPAPSRRDLSRRLRFLADFAEGLVDDVARIRRKLRKWATEDGLRDVATEVDGLDDRCQLDSALVLSR